MDWEAIRAVAELAGAVAIVASLAYLALQVRQNTQTLRASIFQGTLIEAVRMRVAAGQDPKMATLLYETARHSYSQLPAHEQKQALHLIVGLCRLYENVHHQHARRMIDDIVWEPWDHEITEFVRTSSFQQLWEEIAPSFNREFRAYVERARSRGHRETAATPRP
jgi:hypothetical protein